MGALLSVPPSRCSPHLPALQAAENPAAYPAGHLTFLGNNSGQAAKKPVGRFDDLVGQGANLWSDDESERFRIWLRERRRTKGTG
jgi:hypothetical protein